MNKFCECGCGREVNPGKRFIIGHSGRGKHFTEKTKQKMSDAKRNPPLETREKMSVAKSGKNNPMYGRPPPKGSGYSKGSYCKKGHWVRSTWERTVADFLFGKGVEYEYEPKRFTFNGNYSYVPDFYIPKRNLYIEVKGYMRSKNEIQHKLFKKRGYNLLVIGKQEYKNFEELLGEEVDI